MIVDMTLSPGEGLISLRQLDTIAAHLRVVICLASEPTTLADWEKKVKHAQ